MTPAMRREVGRTGLDIPVLGLGTCPLGGVYAAIGEAGARATYEAAWAGGIRFYDTAPWYGLGQAEHRTGRALYERPRGDYVLTTKVGRVLRAPRDRAGFTPPAWQAPLAFEPHHIFTYDAVMRSYEDSLQRLGINQVDALYIHDLDGGYFRTPEALEARLRELDQGGGYRALDELKRSGEIRAIGAGINERGMIRRFLEATDLDLFLVASRYTLLEHDIYQDEITAAGRRGASIVVGGAFSSGILATGLVEGAKYEYGAVPPGVADKVRRLSAIAAAHGISLAAAALQFPLAAPEVCSVVFGAVTPAEVTQNIAHFGAEIPQGFWSDLRSEGLVAPDVPLP
ncbi:aldo/keto reductase [Pseudogemmobacter faecipullorum]|uniref:Aldo/keto reductase n=1 Tax=Pseudogemmobacter faecipullorum TaxID=2755041 RepID=A0ABS8CPG7_9RHOB|nr:aldo/keto reductase [Pseudogemmobacter faecipullorum]MCB5411287.1 aldo/keto reductase [Pseudogemmobacter faecipullorum]